MALHYWWWLAALLLGIVEMLTGTFYLLVLAVGCAGAAIAAWAGAGLVTQTLLASALTLAGWIVLYRWRPLRGRRAPPSDDPDLLLDVGEQVEVSTWQAHGRADVSYRGARWEAELVPPPPAGRPPAPGRYRIRGIVGNRLQLVPLTESENAP